jgi:NAD(P)-dependent dehydrogenase (short-subunit alcohol dehydrogenase family)
VNRLQNKVALITGIGGGMGRAAALRFAAEGARVVGADLFEEGLQETVRLVRAAGGEITGFAPINLADAEAAANWVDTAAGVYGGIDILYNNASSNRMAPIEELSIAEWDYTIRHELDLVFYACKAAWPHLKARGGGVILNTASIAGTRGVEFVEQNAHGAAKAGVINLTQQLAVEGGPHGIRVVALSPGFTVTSMTAWLIDDGPQSLRDDLARTPLRRAGQPEDIVNAALFLASDEASWITGTNLVVDGGRSTLG